MNEKVYQIVEETSYFLKTLKQEKLSYLDTYCSNNLESKTIKNAIEGNYSGGRPPLYYKSNGKRN